MNNPSIITSSGKISYERYILYYVETNNPNLINEKIDTFLKNYKEKSINQLIKLKMNHIYNLHIEKCFDGERFHFTYAVIFDG